MAVLHDEGKLTCFKVYDIRGRVPDELNADIAHRIGLAYGAYLMPEKVIIGYDARLHSPALAEALSKGITKSGSNVIDIGMCKVHFQKNE